MKPSNILLILFLLLVARGHYKNSGALCDYASSSASRKSQNYCPPTDYHRKSCTEPNKQTRNPVTVKVRYEPSGVEKCDKEMNMKKEQLCRHEIEVIKEVAAKSKVSGKCRTPQPRTCSTVAKDDFEENDVKRDRPMEKGSFMCAECEQCSLQVKASGDGVVLKCKDCRELSDNVVFPAGNNRKIIMLP